MTAALERVREGIFIELHMNVKIHSEFSNANLDQMREVYCSVGWVKHSNEIIQQVFEASNVVALASVDERIIGFGRAITDGVFNAAIYDVVVHPEYQNQGVGKKIMEHLMDKLADGSCVHLISTSGNEAFYRKMGFKRIKTGMARYLNEKLASEYLE